MEQIDSDSVVRFLIGDDERRFREAFKLFRDRQLFVSDAVMVETARELSEAHGFSVERISGTLDAMFELPNVHVSDIGVVGRAIERYRGGADFAEALRVG